MDNYTIELSDSDQWVIRNPLGGIVYTLRHKDEDYAREILCNLNATTKDDDS